MKQTKHQAIVTGLERQVKRLTVENRRMKSAMETHPYIRRDVQVVALDMFLAEYGALVDAADPKQGRRIGPTARSAEPGMEGDSTRWLRARLKNVDRSMLRLVDEIRSVLGTPADNRELVVDGKCVACGKPARRRRTEAWHAS